MLEVEPTGRRGRKVDGSVACAAPEAFARWPHRRYAPVEQPSA